MYDATIGRWMEPDPEGFLAGDANLYRYVNNDPTSRTDPSGLQATNPGGRYYYEVPEPDRTGRYFTAYQAVRSSSRDVLEEAIGLYDRQKGTITRQVNFKPYTMGVEQLKFILNTGLLRPNGRFVGFRLAANDWDSVFTTVSLTPDQQRVANADELQANAIIRRAGEILNSDTLWANAVRLYADRNRHAHMNSACQFRDYYRALVNKVIKELAQKPPIFLADDGSAPPRGTAFTKEKGGPIYLRRQYFSSSQFTRNRTLIHEYGRTYLWDELPKDLTRNPIIDLPSLPVSNLDYIENWDEFIDFLGRRDYETIKNMR